MVVKVLISLMVLYLSIIPAQGVPKHGKVVVCYCKPNEINVFDVYFVEKVSLCSHLVIENGYIVDNTNNTIAVDYKETSRLINYINATKVEHMISIKVLVTIKIGYEKNVFNVPSNQRTRDQLIQNIIDLARDYNFDGFDLYLSDFPESPEDAKNLVLFAQDLKKKIIFSPKYEYILTATVVGLNKVVPFIHELVNLSVYLDHIQIPTTNLITTSQRLQYTFAPLKARAELDFSSVEFTIKRLLANGVKPVKLILLLDMRPFIYLLTDSETTDIRLEDHIAIDNENADDLYLRVCYPLSRGEEQWHYHWSEANSARYLKRDSLIIFSENPRSVVAKVKMGIDYGLRGFASRLGAFTNCLSPNDTYTEFIERYNELKEDSFLLEKLKDLNLPNVDAEGKLDGRSYGVFNNTLYFQAPKVDQRQFVLETIDQAIAVSLEEKEILDALKTNRKPYCLFWPVCAAPIPLTTPATDASDTT